MARAPGRSSRPCAPGTAACSAGERRLGPRHHQAAGGVLVEPVDESEPVARRGPSPSRCRSAFTTVRVGRAARRVDHHAGAPCRGRARSRVLVEHGEREVLRRPAPDGLGGGDLDGDPLAARGAAPRALAGRPSTSTCPSARSRWTRARERSGARRDHGQVEADAGPRSRGPGARRRSASGPPPHQILDFTCPLGLAGSRRRWRGRRSWSGRRGRGRPASGTARAPPRARP